MEWALEWNLPEPLKIMNPKEGPKTVLFQSNRIGFSCVIDQTTAQRVQVNRFTYHFANRDFLYERIPDKVSGYRLSTRGGSPPFKFKRSQGRAWSLPQPVKCYGYPEQVYNYYQNTGFLPDFQLRFEQLFTHVFYLGPLREYPSREYSWSGAQPSDMGRRGEKVVQALLASRGRGEKISRGRRKPKYTLEEYVAHWLKELNLIETFVVKPLAESSKNYQVLVKRGPGSPPVLITDVGFGISQILPVIVLCYYVPEGSTIILEQPEIHLHPSVQAGLADVFIDAIKVRKIQIILESHSEHLLRRLQRRIAEAESLTNDDVALYFCEDLGGESHMTPLEVDMFGTIRNWPRDFFGSEFEEMAETTSAAMRRRMEMTG